ncbi:MAG: TonB-dependent receptor, partial [Saprospiraceae bacterium]
MTRRFLQLTGFLVLLLTCSQTVFGQGTIRGYIKDGVSKEDIIGANVLIESLGTGAAGDINGYFSINKVPAGTYTLIINSVGYKTKKVENIQVSNNNVTELNIFTDNESTALNEVVITSNRLTFTEVSVLSDIKAAQQVISGISSTQIAKSLDRNAAEVVKRIPGVTIFNERFINIRGLNERYNTVMLNNTFTPSMESDVRSFSFDVIPSNQIDRILVYKSPAAELPGEFAGGVVKIYSKSIPDQTSLTIDLNGSYRNGTTGKEFFAPKNGSGILPLTGFNDGYNDLPSSFPSTYALKSIAVNNIQRLQQVGRSLKNTWSPVQSNALPDQRIGITGTIKTRIGKVEIGNVTAINYSNTNSFFNKTQNDFGYANFERTQQADVISVFNDKQYTNATRLGLLHNWAVKLNDHHVIEFKNLYNQLSNGQFINRQGFENGADWNIESFNQNYRGIYTGQLMGKHDLNHGMTKVDWFGGYNQSYNQIPDYKRFRYDASGKLLVPTGAAQTFNLGRTNIDLNEKAFTGGININQKIMLNESGKELEIKAGGYYELKDRNFTARNLGYVQANSSLFNIGNLPIEQIFAPQNINTTTGVKIDEQTN